MELRICIDVDNLARARAFYAEGLGLQVGRRFDDEWAELLGAGSAIDLLVHAPGTQAVPGQPAVRNYQRHWTPVHLDIVVDDLDAAVARLLRAGAMRQAPIATRAYGRIAARADSFGHGLDLLELNQRGYDAIAAP